MPSDKEYYKQYRRAARQKEKGERTDLTDLKYNIKFETKEIKPTKFKKIFDGKIESEEQELVLNNCLDLITLINSAKECLAMEGTFVKNATGALKVNPAQKELRENIKTFNKELEHLNSLLVVDDTFDLESWLDDEED